MNPRQTAGDRIDIRQTLTPGRRDLALLEKAFAEYAATRIPDLPDESEDQAFLFSAYAAGQFIGGISGKGYWDGLEIDLLWVDAGHRGRGYGKQLVAAAEDFARDRGAVVAFLKTVEAVDFYQHLGYTVYGRLEDRPIGTLLFHLKKRLDAPPRH